MAASGVMSDFARMPTGRKVLVFVIVGALLGLVYFRFVLSSLKEDLAEAKDAYSTNKAMNQKLGEDIKAYAELRPRMDVLNTTINENKKALPTEAEVPAFFDTLVVKAKESGVEVKVTPKPTEPIESFVKIPAELELTGTFMQIKRFFASLVDRPADAAASPNARPEERERIVSIENLVLSQPTVRAGQIILNARFTAVTFRQQDAAPATPGAPGAAPARPPASAPVRPPAPAGTAPPPLPTPGPIGKAKAAVETIKATESRGSEPAATPGSGSGGK